MKKIRVTLLGLMVCQLLLSGTFALAQRCLEGYCPCKGNFDCDKDIDGADASKFKSFFGCSVLTPCCRPNCQAPLSKTGQTTSYATGDDGDLKVGIAWEEPRFYDNGDGTMTDGLTGLIWLKNANCFGARGWDNALSDCNGLEDGQCGLTDGSYPGDWRLPNHKELFSLVDANNYNPPLPSGHPFINVVAGLYLSSTTYVNASSQAWYVGMVDGHILSVNKITSGGWVWPVRGGH